ncbi:MAG: hypothetical protein ACOVKV_09990 [Novosphingobium sp.]
MIHSKLAPMAIRSLLCVITGGALLGGWPTQASPPGAVPGLSGTSEPAAAVATLLVAAETSRNDPRRLGRILAALDAFGARPMEGSADPVAAWRTTATMPDRPPYRGRVLGPAYRAGKLDPGATVRLPQLFDGGRTARVAIATPGLAALDFTVLDGEARPVCPPAKARNRECMWTPLFSGRFEIVLSNPSGNSAGYYIVID